MLLEFETSGDKGSTGVTIKNMGESQKIWGRKQ